MAWFNPFSWGGGPDEVDYGPMRGLNDRIMSEFEKSRSDANSIQTGITGEDRKLYDESYGAMRDQVMRDIEQKLPGLLQGASGQAGARGMAGSAVEQGARSNVTRGVQRDAANTMSQFGMQQAGQMTANAQNRSNFQLTRNQGLWQNLLSAYKPQQDLEMGIIKSEQDRIAAEKGAFGGLVGNIAGALTPGLGNIPGMGFLKPTPPATPT